MWSQKLIYYTRKLRVRLRSLASPHRLRGTAFLTNAAPAIDRYSDIVFYFDDPLMHIGDQMFFKPLVQKLRAAGFRVRVHPTGAMRFFFPENAPSAPSAGRSLIVSRVEALDTALQALGSEADYFVIQTSASCIDRPVCNYIVDSFCDYFGTTQILRTIGRADFLPIEWPSPPDLYLAGGKPLILLSPYIDSGRWRIRRGHRVALLERLRADKERREKAVVLLGTDRDRQGDDLDYSGVVDVDLRGRTKVSELAALFEFSSVDSVYCFDTAILHFANLYSRPIYLGVRRFLTSAEQKQKEQAFVCIYGRDRNHITTIF